jgi:hypothetical protein
VVVYGGGGIIRLLAAIKSKIYIRRNWAQPKKNTPFCTNFSENPCTAAAAANSHTRCIFYRVRNIIFICGPARFESWLLGKTHVWKNRPR